jgi:hypothetical protein
VDYLIAIVLVWLEHPQVTHWLRGSQLAPNHSDTVSLGQLVGTQLFTQVKVVAQAADVVEVVRKETRRFRLGRPRARKRTLDVFNG